MDREEGRAVSDKIRALDTGSVPIRTKEATDAYRDGWERAFACGATHETRGRCSLRRSHMGPHEYEQSEQQKES